MGQYESEHPRVVDILSSSLYVDDFISSASEVTEDYAVTTTAKNIMSEAGMELCKWMTNSLELKEKWLESLMDCAAQPEPHGSVLKVLGLVWRPASDDFVFRPQGDARYPERKRKHKTKCSAVISSHF